MKRQLEKSWTAMMAASALLFGAAGLSHAEETEAFVIPPEAAVQVDAVTPLKAAYYNFERVRPVGTPGIDSLEIAKDFIRDREPDAKVVIPSRSVIDFPPETNVVASRGQTVGTFLLGPEEMDKRLAAEEAGGDPVPDALKVHLSTRNIFVFTGYFEVPRAGAYEFRVPADDGGELTIGGVVVHVNSPGSGMYAAANPMYLTMVTFKEPGIYPLELVFFDKAVNLGVMLFSDVNPRGEFREIGDSPGAGLILLPFLDGQKSN